MATRRTTPKKTPARKPRTPKPRLGRTTAQAKGRDAGRKNAASGQEMPRFAGQYISGRAKVSSKGWIVIPKAIRDEMGLRPGDEVDLHLWPPSFNMKQDRGLYTLHLSRVPEDPVALGFGMFKRQPGEPSWTENLIEERRGDAEIEERKAGAPHDRRSA